MNKYILLFLIPLFFMPSCSYNTGQMASYYTPAQNEKIEYVDITVGYSKASYFFGIGGFNKNLLYNNAKRNLFFSCTLKPKETLENITIDHKTHRIGPFKKIEVVAVADVIKHSNEVYVNYNKTYSTLLYNKKANTKRFIELNENILIYNASLSPISAKVINHGKKATVIYLNDNGNFIIKDIANAKIFKTSKTENVAKEMQLNIGDSILYSRIIEKNVSTDVYAPVIAINSNAALIKDNDKIILITQKKKKIQ